MVLGGFKDVSSGRTEGDVVVEEERKEEGRGDDVGREGREGLTLPKNNNHKPNNPIKTSPAKLPKSPT